MAKLTSRGRKALPESAFALPGRRYPIHDASHARNALARAAQHATPSEQATIKRKVRSRFPGIKVGGLRKRLDNEKKRRGKNNK